MDENSTGWYALYLSITQNLSPAKALSAMASGRRRIRRLSWEQFLSVYREEGRLLRESQRIRNTSEHVRQYQREYRRSHPLSGEQRQRRLDYQRAYRAAAKKGKAAKAGSLP